MKKALTILGNLIHQIQKERGCIALYSGNSEKKICDHTEKQFKHSNKELDIFLNESGTWKSDKIFSTRILEKITTVLKNASQLKKHRKRILSFSPHLSEAINFYTYDIITHLLDIAIEIASINKEISSEKTSAYASFLYWKENVGRERAIGMRGFLSYTFNNQEFIERIDSLIKEQNYYRRTFVALADEKQLIVLKKIMTSPAFTSVDKIHEKMNKSSHSQLPDTISAEDWNCLMSNKIDCMKKVEDSLIDTLEQNTNNLQSSIIDDMPPQKYITSNLDKKYQYLISKLPFFSGIPQDTLSDLLQHARIKEYEKGQVIFLEGESTTKFYIILSGWIKLFKGSITGDETILHMFRSGDTIAESEVFLNTPYSTSAQVAETAVLLILPASVVREYISDSNKLAENMLTCLSLHNQKLVHQMESTRLKSAKDRVGWFLLKLFLSEGKKINQILLPYNKAMIASYLDMTPETFSRTLKGFKERNFKVENNTISIPDINSLCHYCDTDTKILCKRHKTQSCPNIHLLQTT